MPIQILGVTVLVLAGGLVAWRLALTGGPYRSGPWPGLTVRGALMIVAHAAVLAAFAERWPPPGLLAELGAGVWLPLSVLPLLSVTMLMRMPGVASAVCGAYLLPRSLLSVLTGMELPPLLLAPAMAFDLIVWLRRADLPRWPNKWRKRARPLRDLVAWRLALAVIAYELLQLLLAR
jgi:hypothetical protein